MRCMCGDDECPRCYPDVYYQRRREYDEQTVDDRTDRLLTKLEETDD